MTRHEQKEDDRRVIRLKNRAINNPFEITDELRDVLRHEEGQTSADERQEMPTDQSNDLIEGVDYDDVSDEPHECDNGCFCTWDGFGR